VRRNTSATSCRRSRGSSVTPEIWASTLIQDAVIRNFEIIGEASRNIERNCPEFAAAHRDLPLLNAYEMRNALAHGYFRVDLEEDHSKRFAGAATADRDPRQRSEVNAGRTTHPAVGLSGPA
jgi:hypothetical protein